MVPATAQAKAAMEVGFITVIIRPLYALLVRLVADLQPYLERVDASLARWDSAQWLGTLHSGRALSYPVARTPRQHVKALQGQESAPPMLRCGDEDGKAGGGVVAHVDQQPASSRTMWYTPAVSEEETGEIKQTRHANTVTLG